MRFYLAGPFFNEEQKEVMGRIEEHCKKIGLEVYSPRLENFCPPNAPPETRKETFINNVRNLDRRECEFVLARIDDFDPGTMWEIGYSFAISQDVFAFTTVAGRGLNLMLAQSCNGFLQGLPEVMKFLEESQTYNFGRASSWEKSII